MSRKSKGPNLTGPRRARQPKRQVTLQGGPWDGQTALLGGAHTLPLRVGAHAPGRYVAGAADSSVMRWEEL